MPRKNKKYRVKIQKEAIRDVDRIIGWIAEKSRPKARSFLKKLQAKILSLGEFPERGVRARLLESSGESPIVRWVEFKKHLIFYSVQADTVFILHVTGPGQDWLRLFL